MQLEPYLERLHEEAGRALALADEQTRATAERVLISLDPALRLTLLKAITDVAAVVTASLDGDVVEVRMRGDEPDVQVQRGLVAASVPVEPSVPESEDAGVARVSLRLPESLKQQAEQAAENQGQSLNTWLTSAIRAHLSIRQSGARRSSNRVTGWA